MSAEQEQACIDKLYKITEALAKDVHGSQPWRELGTEIFNQIRNTKARFRLLKKVLARTPVDWEEVKDIAKNKFYAIQGDIIRTSIVASLINQEGGTLVYGSQRHDHKLWIVTSADCDVVNARHVRVAPVHTVPADFKSSTSEEFKSTVSNAAAFTSSSRFPLPPLPGDPEDILGHFADLGTLFCIDTEATPIELADRVSSLTRHGWLILKAQLVEQVSRSEDVAEALGIRGPHSSHQ